MELKYKSCPLSCCGMRVRNLRVHAIEEHLPHNLLFCPTTHVAAALVIIKRGLKCDGNYQDLVRYVNENLYVLPDDARVEKEDKPYLRALAVHMGEDPDQDIQLHPLSSPVALGHWNVMHAPPSGSDSSF